MPLINPKIQAQVRDALADLVEPVKFNVFPQRAGGALECSYCAETRQLIEEVAALSGKVSVQVRDLLADAELAQAYGVDKVPAVVVQRAGEPPRPTGIRFYGIPAGYEFASLIEDLRLVSRGESDLAPATLQALARLDQPVHIQVFVTPTCPYCPQAVLLAHRLALDSDRITADMVEAQEFPQLAHRYNAYGVPRTVINDVVHMEGAQPESTLTAHLLTVRDPRQMQRLRQVWERELHRGGLLPES
jgi:glutaredoxin-like protein